MATISSSRFFRGLFALLLMGAALCLGGLAASMWVEAVTGHGSFGGSTLLVVFGFMLLVFSLLVLIVGIVNWRLSRPCAEAVNN